jgi:NAD(P)-dependent dehydrogenase (short-subunit alcohol dehydrogenase family)
MAAAFAAERMKVVLSDVETGPLDEAVAALRDKGGEVTGVPADVATWRDVEALAEATTEVYGAVHVVCNNAGVVKRARTWALTLDDWEWVLGVDLWGVIHGVKAFVPRMLAQGEAGHVVNTASMVGLLPVRNLATYDAAKMAVVGLSEALAMDLDEEGADIGVSVLLPGFIATGITDSARNRPPSLGDTADAPTVTRTTSGIEATMEADEVAAMVVDAVRTGEFWILTHQAYRPVIQARAAGIGTGGRPSQPPIW